MTSLQLLLGVVGFLCAAGTVCTSNTNAFFQIPSPWAWRCNKTTSLCEKFERDLAPSESMSMMSCKLTCGKYGMLWPRPRGSVTMSTSLISFLPSGISITKISAPTAMSKNMAEEAVKLFLEQVHAVIPAYAASCSSGGSCGSSLSPLQAAEQQVVVEMAFTSPETVLSLSSDESYTLVVNTTSTTTRVYIIAESFFGARHALETLSQLIGWDEEHHSLIMTRQVTIDNDSPVYPHRGLLIDTSRNYLTVTVLKRIISAMSYNKLNAFHWHITDTHSFPFVSRRSPLLTLYGAYSAGHVYTGSEIEDLVRYATVRGVKIIPEFDAPSHVGNGWQWGPKYGLGDLALCINKEPWLSWCVEPPCGQLNPVNENVYKVLGDIYKDMADVFQTDIFHMGGDEVKMDCWNETQEIVDWLNTHNHNRTLEDFVELWNMFQIKALEQVDEAFPHQPLAVLWTSELTRSKKLEQYLNKTRYIIHYWETGTSHEFHDIYKLGYKMIISNYDALYLDCGYGAWVGEGNNWCSPYKSWQLIYDNSPMKMVAYFNETFREGQILGGEAALWSEQTDSASVETKLWPRGAALAERLWSEPKESWRLAEYRMIHQRQRLIERGIPADALQPIWCYHNEGLCYN